jgi:haloalkane dehalogenase
VDDEQFPFESRFVEIDGNVVHYIDEGNGPVLLMLHGNPTWSFLYRDLVRGLSDSFRCVALDYPGFGLSRARASYRFLAREHAAVVQGFVERLDLSGITPVVQDWGGPIGFAAAVRAPERYRSFVVGNTWAWPVAGNRRVERFSRFMGGPVGRLLIRNLNVFVNVFVPAGHSRRKPTREEMSQYRGPFRDRDSRVPIYVFPREILAAAALLDEVERGLPSVADRPALIVWADQDRAFTQEDKQRFERLFPDHRTVDLHGVSHYLQDDAPGDVAQAIRSWWAAR